MALLAEVGGVAIIRFDQGIGRDRRRDPEQFAGTFEMRLAGGTGEQAVTLDAVEAFEQDMEKDAADELVGGQ